MPNLMSSLETTTDVPVMLNGRNVKLRPFQHGFTVAFPKYAEVSIPGELISGCVYGVGRIGICLSAPMVIVPRTKKGIGSFILTRAHATTNEEWEATCNMCRNAGFCYDARHIECVRSLCNRTDVQMGNPVVVWTKQTCTPVHNVELAVLQRTKGGMSSFDVHLVPAAGKGPVYCIEMLPHSMMDAWEELYPGAVIDAGPDPVHPSVLELAQSEGRQALLDALEEAAYESSDSASAWEMSDEDDMGSDSSGSSDSSCSSVSQHGLCPRASSASSSSPCSSCSYVSDSHSCASSGLTCKSESASDFCADDSDSDSS